MSIDFNVTFLSGFVSIKKSFFLVNLSDHCFAYFLQVVDSRRVKEKSKCVKEMGRSRKK